jgi:K+-sensing histidine kinase KdpD
LKLTKIKGKESMFETTIIDTGCGIAKERIRFLFHAFGELYQKQCMRHVKDRGIGVGLNCSKIITEAMNGQIRLISSDNGKTEIKISLPVKTSLQAMRKLSFENLSRAESEMIVDKCKNKGKSAKY